MEEFSGAARFRYDLRSATSLALDSIFAHKLRSFLTLLGIMIGVASVILVGSAIDGMGTYAKSTTEKAFGSETFILGQLISVGNISQEGALSSGCKRNRQDQARRRTLPCQDTTTTRLDPLRRDARLLGRRAAQQSDLRRLPDSRARPPRSRKSATSTSSKAASSLRPRKPAPPSWLSLATT